MSIKVQNPISNNQYSRSQRIFGVIFGLVLLGLGGLIIYRYPPIWWLEILVMLVTSLSILMIGGWTMGKRKWGWFGAILFLALPIMFRAGWLNLVTVAIWLLVLGLISLIN